MKYRLKNRKVTLHSIITITILITLCSCKKLLDVEAPITSENATLVYSSDGTAIAAITGIYTKLSQSGISGGITAMSLFPSLSSDELDLYDEVNDLTFKAYFNNSLSSTNSGATDFWSNIYLIIYSTNLAIEGLNKSSSLTSEIKMELLGEAKFIRGFCYFYLVNLYGDVPLVLSSNYIKNSVLPREKETEVYKQIVQDLKDAQTLLNENYVDITLTNSTEERITPNKWTATAMLARTFLYMGDNVNAEIEATSILENKNLYDTVPLNQVFLKNSKEAIWQLQSVDNFVSNTSDARLFILPPEGPNTYQNQVSLSNNIIRKFEEGDNRKKNWTHNTQVGDITYYYPFKYKNNEPFSSVTEYTVIIRLAELYLIRAEARIKQSNLEGGANDLNLLRHRAGLHPTIAVSQQDLLNAILDERAVELFTEWGHRWLDLKRFGKADEILRTVKLNNWQSTDQLYPIPQNDINRNPSLKGHQNPGYN